MIDTEHLVMTKPSLADAGDSYAMSSDASVARFIGGKPATQEDAWYKLLRNIGHWTSYNYGIFTVREKATGSFVGEVGLAHFSRGLGKNFDPFPEAACILAPIAQGRGYGTEAMIAAHKWMLQVHRPPRTVCIVHPDNLASIRMVEKVGYVSFGEVEYRASRPKMFKRGDACDGAALEEDDFSLTR